MDKFLEAVGRSPLSVAMQNNADLVIPLIQSVHIICLAMVFTCAVLLNLRLLGVTGGGQSLPRLASRYLPWIGWGVVVLFCTGLLLMIAEPKRAILNHIFQIKMAALVIVGVLTWALGAAAARRPEAWAAPETQPRARLLAIVSLGLWAVVVLAGRWIAYAG